MTSFPVKLGINSKIAPMMIDMMASVLDDLLSVTCEMTNMKGAALDMHQEIWCKETLLVSLDVKLAYVSLTRKRPVRIPEELIKKIESL